MFISACCEPFDKKRHNPETHSTGDFWRQFRAWCDRNLYHVPNKSEFRRELAEICEIKESELESVMKVNGRTGRFYPYVYIPEKDENNGGVYSEE